MSVFLQAALEYAHLGYPVFPCVAGGKSPATGNGFHSATTDVEQIKGWWVQADYNVAICTNNLLVVDIDNPEIEIEDYFPDTSPIASTPRGGRHYWHQQFPDRYYHCTIGKLAPNVDTRADGGYVVVPPSRTSDGDYNWIRELDTVCHYLPTVPQWLETELDKLEFEPSAQNYLPDPDGVIAKGMRNDSLFRFGCYMRRGGSTSDEILTLLVLRNSAMCQPPLPDKEVVRIADSAMKYSPDQLTSSLITMQYEHDRSATPTAQKNDIPNPGEFPSNLLDSPGFIGEYLAYADSIAKVPQPALWLAGAISAQGCLCARQICDAAGNYTCLYNIGLASSGKGKDIAYKINRELISKTFPTRIRAEGIASDAGLLTLIEYEPTSYIALDEFGRFLKVISGNQNSWTYQVGEVFLKMFSAPGSDYQGKAYSELEKTKSIKNPCITLFGTSVPANLFEALQHSDNSDGLLGRLLFFWGDDTKQLRSPIPDSAPVPDILHQYAKHWLGQYSRTNIKPTVDVIPYSADGQRAINEYSESTNRLITPSSVPMYNAVWARAGEKARRLALVYSASRNPRQMVLDLEAVRWAIDVVDYATKKLLYEAQYWISSSYWANLKQGVLRLIRRHMPRGINARHIAKYKVFSELKPREREELLADMLASGDIMQHEHKPSRGPSSQWLQLPERNDNEK